MLASLLPVVQALGQDSDLDGEQIIRKVDTDHRAKSERGLVEMTLVGRNGKRQRRQLELLFKQGEGEDDKNLLRFLSPTTIRGTALLTIEATGRADDQWIYLPALRKSKKIASSKRTNRFAQTDFTYEDLRTEDFESFTYKRLDDHDLAGPGQKTIPCYVVEAKPKDSATTGYSRRVLYVERERFLTWKVEFYDKKNQHQKTLLNSGFEKFSGLWRAKKSMMMDLLRGSRTIWAFSERKINLGLTDSTFSVTNLERGN